MLFRIMAAKSLILKLTSALVTYIFLIILARITTPEDFGLVGTILSASLFFSVLGCLGQRMAVIKFVSPVNEVKKWSLLFTDSFWFSLKGSAIVYILLCTLMALFIDFTNFRREELPLLFLGLLLIPSMACIDMLSHLARARGMIISSIIFKEILWRGLSVTILFFVFLTSNKEMLSAEFTIKIMLVILLILITVQWFNLHYKLGQFFTCDFRFFSGLNLGAHELRDSWSYFWVFSLSAIFFTNFDVIAAGLFLEAETTATYFAANRLAMIPSIVFVSINVVVAPMYSKLFAENSILKVESLAGKVTALVFILNSCAALILVAFSSFFLSLFGLDFLKASNTLYILLVGSMLQVGFGNSELVLSLCGKKKEIIKLSIFSIFIGTVSIFSLASLGTSESVAAGTVVGIFLTKLFGYRLLKDELNIRIDIVNKFLEIMRKYNAGSN